MVGGAIFGYCSMGSDINPKIPRMTIITEITVDNTGLLINVFSMTNN